MIFLGMYSTHFPIAQELALASPTASDGRSTLHSSASPPAKLKALIGNE